MPEIEGAQAASATASAEARTTGPIRMRVRAGTTRVREKQSTDAGIPRLGRHEELVQPMVLRRDSQGGEEGRVALDEEDAVAADDVLRVAEDEEPDPAREVDRPEDGSEDGRHGALTRDADVAPRGRPVDRVVDRAHGLSGVGAKRWALVDEHGRADEAPRGEHDPGGENCLTGKAERAAGAIEDEA